MREEVTKSRDQNSVKYLTKKNNNNNKKKQTKTKLDSERTILDEKNLYPLIENEDEDIG